MNPKNVGAPSAAALAVVVELRTSVEGLPALARKLLELSDDGTEEADEATEEPEVEPEGDDVERLEAICSSCDFLLARVQRELRELKLAKAAP